MNQIVETNKYINKQNIIITSKLMNKLIYISKKKGIKSINNKSRGQDLWRDSEIKLVWWIQHSASPVLV